MAKVTLSENVIALAALDAELSSLRKEKLRLEAQLKANAGLITEVHKASRAILEDALKRYP
jgi:hypothetical protein